MSDTTPAPAPLPEGAQLVDVDERPPGVEMVPWDGLPPNKILVRPIAEQDGFTRLRRLALRHTQSEGAEARREREVREADVTEAARRSQAEIRRHVDAYLKEHFEGIAADIANLCIERMSQRIAQGFEGVSEAQQIALDRMAANIRTMFRAFARKAWSDPSKEARRARKGPAVGAHQKKRSDR